MTADGELYEELSGHSSHWFRSMMCSEGQRDILKGRGGKGEVGAQLKFGASEALVISHGRCVLALCFPD